MFTDEGVDLQSSKYLEFRDYISVNCKYLVYILFSGFPNLYCRGA